MKLDVSVIVRSPQVTNPLGERELDLRSHGLTLLDEAPLEQLDDGFDCMDLSENDLEAIEYVPPMRRLGTLIAHKNKLQRISLTTALNLPNLHSFIADDNAFSKLEQLVVFAKFKSLQRISLGRTSDHRNPVAEHELFRTFLIYLCPKLKLINFQRVLAAEREASRQQKQTFEDIIRSASGAAALSMQLTLDASSKVRKRSRQGRALLTQSQTATGSNAGSTTNNNGSAGAAQDGAAVTESVLDAKITELATRIENAETEEELRAYSEELAALEEARNKIRRRH